MSESQVGSPGATGTVSVPTIVAAGCSDVGRVREHNEDAYLIATLQRSMAVHDSSLSDAANRWFASNSLGTLLVVADGMGGHDKGDVASQMAVRTIADYALNVMPWVTQQVSTEPSFRNAHETLTGIRAQLSNAVLTGDANIRQASAGTKSSLKMGTTLTLAYAIWPRLYVVHVGDSRCYLYRGGKLSRLTKDHTLAQQIIDQGYPGLDASSHLHDMLWNSLGGSEDLPSPQAARYDLLPGDTLLLCSDGLSKHVNEAQIAAALATAQAPDELCRGLVAQTNAAGGSDNVTVVIARVGAA
ncbi:MAG: protein phosphatase 2C domain-containing protein [Polyangiaceae bacterium]|nr:protein phosphatase 2C domain-containing protein [Polyangiaceae bacterium]